jgi:hypothetical protein
MSFICGFFLGLRNLCAMVVDVTTNGAPPAHSGIECFEGCTKLGILPLFLMEGIESQASAVLLACVSMFTGNGAKKLCGECVHTCHVCVYVNAVGCGCIALCRAFPFTAQWPFMRSHRERLLHMPAFCTVLIVCSCDS